MARNKGIFPFAANFEVKAASPLDPRVLVENKSELISKDTWPLDGDTLYIYKGLLVSVQEERAIYMLVDPDKILETDYSGWERKDGSSPGAVSYEDIYIIEGLTAQDIYMFEGGILNIDGRDLSEAINSNKRVYIKYSNNAGKAGIIPCSAYKEDVYYVSFRLGSSLYGFDIGADSQYIDETSMFHIDIQEKLESGENIKRINGQSILGRGEITIEGLPSAIPDWNENDPSAASYIKNRTHYEVEHEITNGFTLVGFLYNKCKYDEDTDGYYTTSDIKIRYNEDDYEGTIIIQKGTLLGYDNFNDEVTITGEDQGEEFEFTSYIEDYNIYLKVSNPLGGTNFRLLEYTTLDDAYIPDTIARKSDLENIGGGGSADSGEITEIKTTLDSHNELIEDLQNMKIDKENDDYYPNMSVGVADNLSGVDVVASEFTSRQSGGGAILDGTARIEAIKGNSIIWNQLTKYPEFGPADGWYKSGGPDASSVTITIIEPHDTKVEWEVQVKAPQGFSSGGSFFITPNIPLKNGHKYFYSFDIKKNTTVNTGVYFGNVWANFGDVIADSWHTFHYFVEPTDNFDRVLYLYPFNGLGSTAAEQELIALIKNLVTYDLTQMFGAGNEPTTVEEFYARMPIEINTSLYNKGQMINLNPSGIKSYSANEEPIERFQDLSLIGTLFPDGMKSVGEFHDEIRYNKETQKWEKITRIGEVDLGSLNWGYSGSLGYFYSSPSEDIGDGNTFKETNKQVVLINSADFTGLHWSAFIDNYVSPRNNAISLFYTPDWDAVRANILCNEYTDAASFKEYLQGKKAYFVLNDPIVEEIDFDGNLDYQVWNGGTEELVADNPTAPLRADIAYGFNAVGKIKELEEKINSGGGGGVSKEYVDTKVTELSEKTREVEKKTREVEVVLNGSPQETLDWQQEGYYGINDTISEGDVVDVNVRPNSVYRCLMVECSEGDSFLYTGRNSGFRPFAFLDAEYRLLPNYGVLGTKYKNEQITAPQGAAYVILQTIYNEWVELGSLPCQRQERKSIEDSIKKVEDAVLVSPNIRTASESIQALTNLNIQGGVLNNICSVGNFADASLWRTSTPNMTLTIANGVVKMTSSNASGNAASEISASNFGWLIIPQGKKAFFAVKTRTNIDNLYLNVNFNSSAGYKSLFSETITKDSIWAISCVEYVAEAEIKATTFNIGLRRSSNVPNGGWYEFKDLIVGVYDVDSDMTIDKFTKLVRNTEWFIGDRVIPNVDRFIDLDTILYNDVVVSVGEQGDFQTINAAMAYLSQFYPMYKNGGINAEIRILNGTTITDQVLVVGADYSWITITYEGYNPDRLTYDNVAESIANGTIVFGQTNGYNAVAVDASAWKDVTHDTRGDVCLFRAEDGGKLPKIKCVFKLVNKGEKDVAGICCNRGSACVVATLCGFIGFNDGVIANNESSIVIREGITMDCGRWGCHARHNGEVSARSVIAVGCATDAKYSGESAALCADRIADLDGREAWVSCGNAFAVRNTSRMNCNGTHILGTTDETAIIYANAVSVGNFTSLYIDAGVKIDHSQGAMLSVSEYTFRESYVFNDVTNKGIIYK